VTVHVLPGYIPSPPESLASWQVGSFTLHAYSLWILVGIVVAVWIATRRWVERGGQADTILEISFWAVPFGVIGGRLYHLATTPDPYFGPGGDPMKAFAVWEGGLGIWGAIALGALGAWIGCRQAGVRLATYADAAAPGVLVAQAIGRLGNWFNQELFGSPTHLPWGLRIDPDAPTFPDGMARDTLFHPTFLYEMVWNIAAAVLLIRLDRRYRWGHGQVFWAYVMAYTSGRVWIESLRIDPAEHVLGLRLNVWTSIVLFLCALVAFVVLRRRHPDREAGPELHPATGADDEDARTPAGEDEFGDVDVDREADDPAEAGAERDAEPAAEPGAETFAEPDVETVAEPAAEPDVETFVEPDAEPGSQPVVEPDAGPDANDDPGSGRRRRGRRSR
jgi:prolipoprotein diacylglyceryl transferase